MHIGIDARLNAYREGGIAEYTRRLAAALADLDRENDYTLIQHVRARGSEGVPGFRRAIAFTPPHHRFERLIFALEVSRLRLDVLHSPDFIPPRFGARRFVITIHDLTFLRYPQFQTADSLRHYAGQIHAAAEQAAHILVSAQAIKTELVELLHVPADKVTIHYLGVDSAFRPLPAAQTADFLRRFGLPSGYVLFVGTFEPRKNLPGLLTAYRALIGQLPDAPPLVIAGRRGWLYDAIFEQVGRLGLTDRVRWLENVPAADMPALYNGAAALAQPSFYEGFGLPPLEAMACGIPTVVAARGSLPEVVGDTGLLVDPEQPESIADGLCRALTDSAFRQRSREAGMARAAGFTWARTAQVAKQVYERAGA